MTVVRVVKEVMRCGVEKPRTGFASRDKSMYKCSAGYTVDVPYVGIDTDDLKLLSFFLIGSRRLMHIVHV